jgi:predicted porin
MKKLLIASAALAMVAGTAQAQSSVSMYGILDLNVQSVTVKSNPGENYGAGAESGVATSRLGFRGTEDLGGGNSIQFNLEGCLNPMTAGTMGSSTTNAIFNREANIQINSKDFGSLRLGTSDITDAGNIEIITSRAGNFGLNPITDIDLDKAQTISYRSPTMNGFRFQAGYASAGQTGANSAVAPITTGNVTSLFGAYVQGNLELYVGAAEQKASAATQDVKQKHFGLRYNAGVVDFGAYYGTVDGVQAATQSSAGLYAYTLGGVDTGGNAKLEMQRYSASVPLKAMGNGVNLVLVYGRDETKTALAPDSTIMQAGFTKAFSKRTTGYLSYRDQDYKLTTAADRKTLFTGVVHSF